MDASIFNFQDLALGRISLPSIKNRLMEAFEGTLLLDECDLIVFSHLRWEFVIQRPQHVISRLAAGRRVLFIEEPVRRPVTARHEPARLLRPLHNLTVVQPYQTGEDFLTVIKKTLAHYSKQLNITNPILWLYSASFAGVVPEVKDRTLVVYDCMDELSAFLGAPKMLRDQELVLMSYADLVFTGGKSLFEAKQELHPNVFCFPSSVDQKHFRKAFRTATKVPADIAAVPGPRVGFYGVIDERIDLSLLKALAERKPRVSFVMIGPVVKISEQDLPQASNIYYLGSKEYRELPRYLKAMDVLFMPFALNQATRFISPTKTLEFMAAHKPIISTPIYDIVRDYNKEVYVAKSPEGFKAAIEYFLQEPALNRQNRIRLQRHVLERTSWDKTVAEMKRLMNLALKAKVDQIS